jgi:hypothetical protein
MTIRVTDVAGLTDTLTTVVDIINVNEPPVILPGQTFSAIESWNRDTLVGVVLATDPDAGTEFNFNIISGNLGAAFVVGTSTGRLTVSWDGAMDYENIVIYNVTLSVTDSGVIGDSSPLKVTEFILVTVSNVNDVALLAFGMFPARFPIRDRFPAPNFVSPSARLHARFSPRHASPCRGLFFSLPHLSLPCTDGNTTLPTSGGGVTILYGVNLGRILPLPDGSDGPAAAVSFGGPTGTKYALTSVLDGTPSALLEPGQCSRQSSVEIRCSVGPGAGANLIWRIAVGPDVFTTRAPLVCRWVLAHAAGVIFLNPSESWLTFLYAPRPCSPRTCRMFSALLRRNAV